MNLPDQAASVSDKSWVSKWDDPCPFNGGVKIIQPIQIEIKTAVNIAGEPYT